MQSVGWTLGIGDPGFRGWFIAVAYFATAALCLAPSLRSGLRWSLPRQEQALWMLLALLFLALGLNKQLDLQSLFTQMLRERALAEGWYADRRAYQAHFLIALLATGAAAMALVVYWLRDSHAAVKLAVLGLLLIVAFVCLRAASFHHLDHFIGFRIRGARMNWLLELMGIASVAAAALWYRQSRERQGVWQKRLRTRRSR